jgi:Leucine-rich repeat (LRR) protein
MARDAAYRKAGEKIETALRTGATELDLRGMKLTELPESLGQLTQLQRLFLHQNQLTALPDWLGRLSQLDMLFLDENQLTALPESLGRLSQLTLLSVDGNQLTALPESLGQLSQLNSLYLSTNPLNPELAAAYVQGIDAVQAYLRELKKGARKRYEAKLLILGDGDEGKTCVSRALRGLPFKPQVTTRGVDVTKWSFSHPDDLPDKEKRITLNIWDFEGQEINHQTHQFFLTKESLYLLVFKCREQFNLERAEYWLDTIRARAP